MISSYQSKLKDPRWYEKRSEILVRDNYQCQYCFGFKPEIGALNVHHLRYLPNHEPWDYPEDLLITLCQYCHEADHQWIKIRERTVRERGKKLVANLTEKMDNG